LRVSAASSPGFVTFLDRLRKAQAIDINLVSISFAKILNILPLDNFPKERPEVK
jgi:hypothetical protein